jgi:hypothetical protein
MKTEKTFNILMFCLEMMKRAFCFFFILSALNIGKILIYYDQYHLQVPHYMGVFLISLVFLLIINLLQSGMRSDV